ncbi:MAG: tetratricopeptide repeat protein [Myxococcaceae bacterium]
MAVCVALLPFSAHAGAADDAKAKALFKEGEKEYNGGNFQAALEKYQQAYDLSPLPGFLFNEAQCYRQLGNFERASFMYGRFIDVSKPKAPNVELATKLKTEVDQKQAEKKAAADAEAAEAKRVADAKAAEEAKAKDAPVAVNLTPPPPVDLTPPPPPPEEKPVYKSGVFWTLVVVGVVAVAGGVTAGVLVSKNQQPQQPPPLSTTTLPNIDAR